MVFAIAFSLIATFNAEAQWTSGTGKVYLTDSTKYVGIGTTTPKASLDIKGSGVNISKGGITIDASNTFTSSHWGPAIVTPLGEAWHTSTPSGNAGNSYLGYGMTNGGWYWITCATTGNTQPPFYPMKLLSVDNKSANLTVQGKVTCNEVLVAAKWWDDVFKSEYNLRPLEEVKAFIDANKHLPDVTPGPVIETEGLEVGKASSQMIRKIEELTLYVIQLNEDIKNLKLKQK